MPERKTLERARKDKREGKAPSTQAGEFVREEIEHVREGKHGARSTKQAIAIGLSKARRAGVKPAQVISIGDEVRDIEAARNAGIACAAVSWGYAAPAALRALAPDHMFDQMDEIVAMLAPVCNS